jgi:hypothetical protein
MQGVLQFQRKIRYYTSVWKQQTESVYVSLLVFYVESTPRPTLIVDLPDFMQRVLCKSEAFLYELQNIVIPVGSVFFNYHIQIHFHSFHPTN